MPSVGGIQKLSVLAVAVALLGVTASTASAAPVWVWACQGPSGEAINTSIADVKTTFEGSAQTSGPGCSAGVSLGFTRTDPAANSNAQVRIDVPASLRVTKVRIVRDSEGLADAPNAYRFTTALDGAGTLEQADGGTPLTGETPIIDTNGSGGLTFSLNCTSAEERCPSGAPTVEIARIGLLVDDSVKPRGGISGPGQSDKTFEIVPHVSDEGVGLERVEVAISAAAGTPALVSSSAPIGHCGELTPADATNDRALDSASCLTTSRDLRLETTTSELPEGRYWRTVTAYDAAGNVAAIADGEFQVYHPPPWSSTQTLSIGTSGVVFPDPGPGGGGAGVVAGAQASGCRSPRLSVSLDSKPVRMSKGRPVLLAKKRYRFEGRLTCVVDGKRRSAPKSTRIEILNKVGKKTVSKPATKLRSSGKLNALLKTPNVSGSRTLIFRYRNSSGQRSQVSIRITITKRAPKR